MRDNNHALMAEIIV